MKGDCLCVCGHSSAPSETGNDGCNSIAKESTPEILIQVAASHRGNSFHMACIFRYQDDGDRSYQTDSIARESRRRKLWQANPIGFGHRGEIDGCSIAEAV